MEGNIFERLLRDCHNSVAGIAQGDPHLLFVASSTLRNHVAMFTNLISGGTYPLIGRDLELLLQDLQHLRVMVEQHLDVYNKEQEVDAHHSLKMEVHSVTELRKLGMPWSIIARVHGVSRNSLYKFRINNNIVEPNAAISDEELRAFISQIVKDHPNAGTLLHQSALTTAGYRASKNRVWLCLKQVDPIGVAMRQTKSVRRRVYRVKAANYLWHIDSTHKLIMYGFVIHGCIDGYSRKVIYCNVADNNTSRTVLNMFKAGVAQCGLPKRVRADRGVENFKVKDFMLQNSTSPNAFIVGRSLHNTRIERLWKDVNCQVTSVYKDIFLDLEAQDYLDINDKVDRFCLPYVYLPRIRRSLDNFVLQWNNHGMSSMGSRTPQQIWFISTRLQGICGFASGIENEENDESEDGASDQSEENEQDLIFECQRVVPDPLSDDFSQGQNYYIALRDHLLRELNETLL